MEKTYTRREVLLILRNLTMDFERATQNIVDGVDENSLDLPINCDDLLTTEERDKILIKSTIKSYSMVLDKYLSETIDKV